MNQFLQLVQAYFTINRPNGFATGKNIHSGYTVYPFMVCTRLCVFVIIFAEMLARQTKAGRGAAEGFSKLLEPLPGILYLNFIFLTVCP